MKFSKRKFILLKLLQKENIYLLCYMKKLILALSIVLGLIACDNDIDINAEYEDITVMYGLLDPKLDTNYVRIQRGYLGDAAASASFGITDSLYYDSAEIDVFIREYRPGGSTIEQEVELIYDESVPVDTGLYTTQGHHLYRVPSNFDIKSSREYEVVVRRSDGSEAYARTGIVGNIVIRFPIEPISSRFFDGRISFDIQQSTVGNNPQATVKMIAYQPIIYFHYREVNNNTGSDEFKTETIRLPLLENPFDDIEILYTSNQLFSALANSIEKDSTKTIFRYFQGMDIEITGASEDMMTFIELSKPATGVNQNLPQFEQVENGTGILTSRTVARRNDSKLQETIYNRLLESRVACDLNFVRIELNGADTCYCINNEKVCF